MKTLQAASIESLMEVLSKDAHNEVVSQVLDKLSLKDILDHPVVLAKYKQSLLQTLNSVPCGYADCEMIKYLIGKTNESKLIHSLYGKSRN